MKTDRPCQNLSCLLTRFRATGYAISCLRGRLLKWKINNHNYIYICKRI